VAAGLLATAVVATGGALLMAAERRIQRLYRVDPEPVVVSEAPAVLARGRHLVEVVTQCTTCHGEDLAGQRMADGLWMGRLYAPNLTPGRGGVGDRSDLDLVRSIRHGLRPDGRPLVVMPAQYLYQLSDADLGAIIAYLRSLPPRDRAVPPRRLGPASVLALVGGAAPDLIPAELLAQRSSWVPAPPPELSAAYGLYLIEVAGCKVCHQEDLSGGLHPLSLPGEPPPPDLRASGPLSTWSEADFVATLRTGVTPDGRRLDEAWMPWRSLSRMSDLELRAIWRGLRASPRAEPSRAGPAGIEAHSG
jgi:mono/diheme cytochrome c family protein